MPSKSNKGMERVSMSINKNAVEFIGSKVLGSNRSRKAIEEAMPIKLDKIAGKNRGLKLS